MSERDKNLRLAAFVLNIVSTVSICWVIIPLAWCIPMTIHSYRIYRGERANTVAFGVCDLIFVNTIAGVLLLVSGEDSQ